MLTIILLSFNIIVCICLIGVVLLQKSEGGALGMGGGPTGFMTARGTGDLLTRATWILFSVFLVISITLTLMSAASRGGDSVGKGLRIDPASALQPAPTTAPAPTGAPTPDVTLPRSGLNTAPSLVPQPAAPTPVPATPEKK